MDSPEVDHFSFLSVLLCFVFLRHFSVFIQNYLMVVYHVPGIDSPQSSCRKVLQYPQAQRVVGGQVYKKQ